MRLKKCILWILFLLIFLCISFVSISAEKKIKVGIYQNKPKVFLDNQGKAQGFFIDILDYIASKEGWQIEYLPATWESNLIKLKQGEIDLLLDIAYSEKRAEYCDINSEIIFSNWAIVYIQENSEIESIIDLRNKKIAAMKGDISYEDFKLNIKNLGIFCTFVEVKEFSEVFELLDKKQVDAGIISRLFGLTHENKYDAQRSTIICCPNNLYFAVPRNQNKFLIERIDDHLEQLKRDDQSIYYKSQMKWIEGISPWKFPVWLRWLLTFVCGLIVLFAASIIVLRIQVNTRTTELNKMNEELKAEIEERKRAEKQKESLQKQLIQSQKMEAIGTLAGGIAHDFNNILTAIISYAEISLDDAPKHSDLQSNLNNLLKAGFRGRDLIKQILTFSRQSEFESKPIRVEPVVKECIKFLRASLPATIDIRLELKSNAMVMADPTQIHQVIMNLCTNAAHAMHEKGGILNVRLAEVELDSHFVSGDHDVFPGTFLRLSVDDTGCGIPPDAVDHIFEPFFTTKEKGEGTGMGLSVVHGIVKKYHGLITISSDPEKGTVFNVFLPVIETNAISDHEKEGVILSGTERILFVDDEYFQVDLGKKIFERLGYEVVAETNSIKALELFRRDPEGFDLVITDTIMPNLPGDKLAKELIAIRPDIPIIICTGYSEQFEDEKAESLGIKAIVMKPLLIKDLAQTVREVLDG
jgi:signal transduction histidine kinase/CheY-like chemotaxis protein